MVLIGNLQGPAGQQGAQGVAGISVIGAQGPPGGACTIEGQIYLDLLNGDTYFCQGGVWVLNTDGAGNPIKSFVGPAGPQGPAGINGTDGQDGNLWFEGNGLPPDGTAQPLFGNEIAGDLYLNLLNGDLYRFQGGKWF